MPPISDVTTLKVVADPLRLRIGMLLIDRAMTVKELAAELGVPPTRLYYHVRMLERHDLVEVVGRRMVSGIEERTYRSVDDAWTVAADFAGAAVNTPNLLNALFAAAEAEVNIVMHDDPDNQPGDPNSPVPVITMTEVNRVSDAVEDFPRAFNSLFDRYPERPGTRRYRALIVAYRAPGVPDAS